MTVTVGADPEFFHYGLRGGDEYRTILPCVGIIPGSKAKPHDLEDGYFTHEDNVCIELGVPYTTRGWDLGDLVTEGKRRITSKFFDDDGTAIYITDSSTFLRRQLESKQAKEFGCEPDFNAYENGKMREVPRNLLTGQRRFAGGHIHIGGDFNCPPFVAALFADIFLSVMPMSAGYRNFHRANASYRMSHYGQPGTFRAKEYGIEYRTPGNWWTASEEIGNHMGNLALSLGQYLENTSATTLRETVRRIDWLSVRSLIQTAPGRNLNDLVSSAAELVSDCRTAGVITP